MERRLLRRKGSATNARREGEITFRTSRELEQSRHMLGMAHAEAMIRAVR